MRENYNDLLAIIDGWRRQRTASFERQKYAEGSSATSLIDFAATHTAFAKQLIRELGQSDPAFWDTLVELSVQASTVCTKTGKTFINGQNRTFETS